MQLFSHGLHVVFSGNPHGLKSAMWGGGGGVTCYFCDMETCLILCRAAEVQISSIAMGANPCPKQQQKLLLHSENPPQNSKGISLDFCYRFHEYTLIVFFTFIVAAYVFLLSHELMPKKSFFNIKSVGRFLGFVFLITFFYP